MPAGAGNTDPIYFNYITYNLSVRWMLAWRDITVYLFGFQRQVPMLWLLLNAL